LYFFFLFLSFYFTLFLFYFYFLHVFLFFVANKDSGVGLEGGITNAGDKLAAPMSDLSIQDKDIREKEKVKFYSFFSFGVLWGARFRVLMSLLPVASLSLPGPQTFRVFTIRPLLFRAFDVLDVDNPARSMF
jgi:hypothetical protein